MPLLSCEGCLKDIFVTETEFINRFTGQQLFTWGRNNVGQLGDNSTLSRSSPIQTVSGGTNWSQMSGKSGLGVAAIKTDGTLWTWGDNSGGDLGNQSTVSAASSPVQTISGGTNWRRISSGSGASLAIKTDGTLWGWGEGGQGQLGRGNTLSASSPVQTVSGGTNWKSAAVSSSRGSGIKTDGTLWIWGNNASGVMGDGTTINRSSPVQTVSAGTNWKQVSIGANGIAAVKTDGTLWVWGSGSFGEIGNGTATSRSSPVQTVSAGTNWKQVAAGSSSVAAVKTDGTLWTWGRNSYGQLGTNDRINRSSPIQTVTGGTNWLKVDVDNQVGAIKTDGTLWTWGYNYNGELGNNTSIAQSSPIQTITSGTSWRDITMGQSVTALKIEE